MPEVVVVRSQEELDQAIQASRTDLSIKRIEIRSAETVALMATGGPVDRGLHDIIHVGPDLVVAGDSQLDLDDGVAARVYAADNAFVGVQSLLPENSSLRGQVRLELRLAGAARAVTGTRLRVCQVAEHAHLEATEEARGTTVLASGDAHVAAYGGHKVVAEGRASVDAMGAEVECGDEVTVEASANARVKAHGRSTVTAMGSVVVEAWDDVRVVARHKAQVVARNETRVVAYDDARIDAFDQAAVVAPGPARDIHGPHKVSISAHDQSHVDASANADVKVEHHAQVVLRDLATADARGLARVDARDQSRVVAGDEASVTLRGHASADVSAQAHVRALDASVVNAKGECRVIASDAAAVRAQGRVEVTATGQVRVEAGDHVQVFAADEATVVATHYAVVHPRVRSDGRLLPATPSAQRECPLRMRVELHDFARVEGKSPLFSLEVTHKLGLPELDLEGLGMAQVVADWERAQGLER